ncbi:MAG TPA: NeuD/PglB/VioB family sugar acetyltransferase [Candidatus Dormibacteraeota bacterium]|nr:NeuD/PglB/VioB family sugar acetyltransferase [Candidatus Dormibacteraeota bacterium]
MEKIIVIGAGGLAKRILDILERTGEREIVGVVAPDRALGEQFFGYPVLGDDDQLAAIVARHRVDAAIVAIGDNWKRACAARTAHEAVPGLRFVSAIHPSAQVARGATIGCGTMVAAGAVLDSDASVGDFALLHIGATVSHDAVVGDFASVGLHAVACGAARIGDYTAIGVGANLIHRVAIGEHTVIGAGSTVTRDIPAYTVAYGSPARVVRQRQQGEPYL